MKRLFLVELDESLKILGHTHLWLRGDLEPDLPDYFEVISSDERELAWWCADSQSWFLTKEVDVITPFSQSQVPALPDCRELINGNIFNLSVRFYC
ncbi:hypothetical protein CD006_26470 [Enterobacter sp. 10-1]|uniref:hypothetical protein n=1 Tax=Raoultella sp. 10-1 TaxID=2683201 RepID=UPI000BA416B0|nr:MULTISPECIES: hypothetical protein [Enterobacteriaceae]MVT06081.1 hypothetical protein [Raoultella sp. 10-1]PAC07340.1 hypothetical protein CD006_26470 [Enterobacter sp. 10-1]